MILFFKDDGLVLLVFKLRKDTTNSNPSLFTHSKLYSMPHSRKNGRLNPLWSPQCCNK